MRIAVAVRKWAGAVLGMAIACSLGLGQAQAQCVDCQKVAVVDIESERDCSYWASVGGEWLVIECRNRFHALRDMIETAIVKTNKFSVYERARLGTVLDERALQEIGVTGGKAYRTKLTGVDFLIYGKITEFGTSSSNFSEQRYAVQSTSAAMALDLKIVNVRTGQIVSANNVREELQTSGGIQTANVSQGTGMSAGSLYGQLQRQVAEAIARELVTVGYPMRVIKVEGEQLYVNYGEGFLNPGQTVTIMRLGDALIDPDTGASLGQTETPMGDFRVEQVTAKFSTLRRVRPGGPMPSPRDIVRIPRQQKGANGDLIERAELPF